MPFTSAVRRPFFSETDFTTWFTPRRFSLFLGLLIFLMFSEVLLGTRTFVFRDYSQFGYPLAHYYRESFWRGEVPLWNPLSNCGLPFMAQWNTMVFYPGSLFYLLLPLSWSLPVFCLGHLFLAGLGMYFLALHWTGNRFAAAVAGLGFAFNGFTLSCLIWPNNIAALGGMPWVIWLMQRGWQRGGNAMLIAALAGSAQMLSGAPEIILFTWTLVLAVWLADLVDKRILLRTTWRRVGGMMLLVAAVAAVQLLPFLDLLRHSQRQNNYANTEASMPPTGWANFLIPLFHCYRSPQSVYFQPGQFWTSSYYAGIGILFLAVLGVLRQRQARVWILFFVALASAILALGSEGHVYSWMRQLFPALGFMSFPIKFVVVIAFVVPALSAFGICAWLRSEKGFAKSAWIVGLVFAALVASLLGFAHRYPEYYERWARIAWNASTRLVVLTLVAGVLWFIASRASKLITLFGGMALLIFLWLDIVFLQAISPKEAPSLNPTVKPSIYNLNLENSRWKELPPITGESRAMLSLEAIKRFEHTYLASPADTLFGHRFFLYANCNLIDGISKVDGFYSLYLREQLRLLLLLYTPTTGYAVGLADCMAVSQIPAPGVRFDWQTRPGYHSLITGGQKPVFADADPTIQALMATNFDSRRWVFLPTAAKEFMNSTNSAQVTFRSKRFAAHRVDLDLEADRPAMVVLAQSFYHPWRAFVDGAPTRIWRADYAFQAVQVPAGQHRLVLRYVDWNFRVGAVISLISLAGCLIGICFRKARTATATSLVADENSGSAQIP